MFQPANLVRYPRLEGTDPDVLYRRAVIIQRYGEGKAWNRCHTDLLKLRNMVDTKPSAAVGIR